MVKKYLIGFMILVVLTASVYILLPNQVRIDVENTKTIFKVYEENNWVLAGTERTILYDGTKKMRASSRTIDYIINKNETIITRTSNFKEGIVAIDTYLFDGTTRDVELYPVEHNVKILNAKGKIFHYEVNDLSYSGETTKDIFSPQSFGHKMKVEWESGNYYSKIFKYKDKDVGKLIIRYKIDSSDFNKNVRLFDPPIDDFIGEGLVSWYSYENSAGSFVLDNHTINNGSLINMEDGDWISGKVGNGLIFDGVDEYVTLNSSGLSNLTNFTFCTWLKHDTGENSAKWITGSWSSSYKNFLIYILSNGTIVFATGAGNQSENLGPLYSGNTGDGNWNFICLTRDITKNNISIWVNSLLNDSKSITYDGGGVVGVNLMASSTGSGITNGSLDETFFSNKVFNSSQINEIYNSGNGKTYDDFLSKIKIDFVNPTKANASTVLSKEIEVNISTNGVSADKIIIYLYNSSNILLNTSIGSGDFHYVNFNISISGVYKYNATANDSSGNLNTTILRFITVYYPFDFNISLAGGITLEYDPENTTHERIIPPGQTSSIGTFLAENNLTFDGSIYAKINDSFSGITYKLGNTNNYSNSTSLNTTYLQIDDDFNQNDVIYIWSWADYNSYGGDWFPELEIILRED